MLVERAIWFPFWYELDQTIEVGVADDFYFFRPPPDYVDHGGLPVFYHGLWSDEESSYKLRRIILSIEHGQFGRIQKIDARGLDYTMTLTDGRVQKIEAEETPGLVYGWPEPIVDWRFVVTMRAAD